MMNTEKMTVSRALIELKTLDKRITDKIQSTDFCFTNKHSNPKYKGKDVADVKANIKSEYESILALIRRRSAIKKAVVQSNATTSVDINGKQYTVAEAIELKTHGMSYQNKLVQKMLAQFSYAVRDAETQNGQRLQNAAESYVTGLYGGKEKMSSEAAIEDLRRYIEFNTLDIIDPLDIQEAAGSLNKEIVTFLDEVDSAITVSNATTTLTISYEI